MRQSGDSQTALQMEKEALLTEYFKYIAIYYHFVRNDVYRGEVALEYVA